MTAFLSKIKNFYFKKQLKKLLQDSRPILRKHGEVKTVGIIFDATSQDNRDVIAQQAENLRKQGKKVRIIGFFNDKNPHEGTPYQYFNLKDLDWKWTPKKETPIITDFIKQPFDLLYTYAFGENKAIDYITALSQANFKAGYFTEIHEEAQLMFDTQNNPDLRFLIRQIDLYLGKINKKQNEFAVAV